VPLGVADARAPEMVDPPVLIAYLLEPRRQFGHKGDLAPRLWIWRNDAAGCRQCKQRGERPSIAFVVVTARWRWRQPEPGSAVLVGAAPTNRVGSVLPDGPGAVSEIGMLKRGTGVGRQL